MNFLKKNKNVIGVGLIVIVISIISLVVIRRRRKKEKEKKELFIGYMRHPEFSKTYLLNPFPNSGGTITVPIV